MRRNLIIAQAGMAVATIVPRITHGVAKVDVADRDGCIRQMNAAAGHARELTTRLEIAALELAATPIEAVGKPDGEKAA